MAAREFLYIVKESSYGVPMATPTLGTDAFYMRLSGSNAFTMQTVPIIGKIMYGGGVATAACATSDQSTDVGVLQTELYAGAMSKFLLDWAATQINTGRTTPWTTTDASKVMPIGDLASCSIYHAYQRDDGAFKRTRHSGVKVSSWTVTADTQNRIGRLSLNLQGIRDDTNAAGTVADPDDTEFPEPAETDYPCNPYLFSHTTGKLKIASARTLYSSVTLKAQNVMDPKWFESTYLQTHRFCGRNTTLDVRMLLKASPDDLASFRALTALDTELTFDNGTNTLKVDLNTNSRWDVLGRDLQIDKAYEWNGTIQNYFDASTGSDVVISAT